MSFVLDAEQMQAKNTAHRFFAETVLVSDLRKLRDSNDALGYTPSVWREMGMLGFPGAAISPEEGGIGLGYVGLGVILEEGGRTLAASPLFATAALGATVLTLAASPSQRAQFSGAVASGEFILTLAFNEGRHHAPYDIQTAAKLEGDHYRLNGSKAYVIDGQIAERIIVTARADGACEGEILFLLVDRNAAGVTVEPVSLVDSRNTAHLTFQNVRIPRAARIGQDGQGQKLLEDVLDRASACLAAEMLGNIDELFKRTRQYVGEREQFGVKIGSFQALRHRLARMFTEIELTRSAVRAALVAIDTVSNELPSLVSIAKARANDTGQLVSNDAVQMHGGIGLTDEVDVGLFLKRLRVAAEMFGSSRYHRDRYASLVGY
jgi:alkylation response protein AidB-like acyl-CoA dehydrogenase